MEKLKLIIEGVTSSNAQSIESKLRENNGIETAKINYDSGKAVIFYNDDKIGKKDIRSLIEKLGDYKVEPEKEEEIDNNVNSEMGASDSFYNNSLWLGVFTGISIVSIILNIILIIVILNK